MCVHEPAPADPYREQKRVFSPLELELHTTVGVQHGCWETSSGPLQEQEVPVTTGTPFSSCMYVFLE